MLEIRLFALPEVLWNNTPLLLPRRVSRAVLFYLAAHQRAVARDSLAALLWPQSDPKNGRARLREAILHLRKALPADLIETTPQSIVLNSSQVRVDYLDFMRLANTISHTPWYIPPEMPLPTSLVEMMTRLTALYRLPGFLHTPDADFSPALAAWRDEMNNAARLTTLRCLDRLYEHARVSSGGEEALQWLYAAARIDLFDEARQGRFLTALLDASLKQMARQHYLALESAYQTERNQPLPEAIAALRRRLFDSTRPASQNTFTWPLRPTLKAPFVGRAASLSDLRRHFISGGGVIILGEAGSGKTRLVQEFYNRLNPSPRLLMGVCRPMTANLPFQPWIDLLRRRIAPHEWRALASAWAAPLARLIPEVYDLHPDLDRYRSAMEHPKSVFFEAVRQILLAAASNAPVIVFLDDVHWADDSTLGLLSYLLEQGFFTGRHGFLIVTSRLEEHNPVLNRLLSASYLNRVHAVQLGPLSVEEIRQLVSRVVYEAPPPGFAERLAREVGGNPFAILETIGAFLERPARPSLGEITRLPLVSGVHQMILARLRMVSQEGRAVLHAAALYGGSLNAGMLAKVVSLPEEKVMRAFEELEALHFIQPEVVDEKSDYIFVHEKFRESLLQDIGPANSYLFNRRIAEVLEAGLNGKELSQAAIIARHYEAAGMLPQAFDYWVKAAQHACDLDSLTEATELYKRAEGLVVRIPTLRDEQLYTFFTAWSDMALRNDDAETLFRISRSLLSIGEACNNPLLIGTAHNRLSGAYIAVNQFAEGLAHAWQAIHHLADCDNLLERIKAHNHAGVSLISLGRLPEARACFDQAVSLSESAQAGPIIRARDQALRSLSVIDTLADNPSHGLDGQSPGAA